MSKTVPVEARCGFYRRTKVTDAPTYRYDMIWVDGWDPGRLVMPHPPAVGDLIYLNHRCGPGEEDLTGNYVVVTRSWIVVSYGSGAWPYGEPHPNEGPLLNIIIEPAKGPFLDKAEGDPDE